MDKIPCTGNDGTGNQWLELLVEFDSVRMRSNLVLKTIYCINKIKNGYKDVEEKNQIAYAIALNLVRSGTRSKCREIEREVVLDNQKQRWPTMFIIVMMYKTNDGLSRE